jgi:hypothetical protein
MLVSSASRVAVAAFVACCALAFGGCNTLLDNRPADIGSDLFANQPADGESDASTPPNEAPRDSDASRPSREPDVDASTAPAPPECLVGAKPCAGACVSTDDAATGCGGPTCESCAAPHAKPTCVEHQCALGACDTGWADCNHLPADGCEVDLSAPASCGGCGIACVPVPNAAVACTAGMCAAQCTAGFGDCNHDPADGCEKPLLDDKHNCGECGRTCIFGHCEAGTCVWKL